MTQHPAIAPKLPLPLLIHATPMSPVPNRRNILIVRGAYAPRASARLPSENLVRTLLKLCFQRGKNCGLTDRANPCAPCISLSLPWHCADENVQKIRTQRSRLTCINRLPRQAAALLFQAIIQSADAAADASTDSAAARSRHSGYFCLPIARSGFGAHTMQAASNSTWLPIRLSNCYHESGCSGSNRPGHLRGCTRPVSKSWLPAAGRRCDH